MKWRIKKIFIANCKWGSEISIDDGWEPFGIESDKDGSWVWLRKSYEDQPA